MKRSIAAWGVVAVLIGFAAWRMSVERQARHEFFPGDSPVTEDQIRDKLLSEGYSDVTIARVGKYFEATVSKDGRSSMIAFDPQTGLLSTEWAMDPD